MLGIKTPRSVFLHQTEGRYFTYRARLDMHEIFITQIRDEIKSKNGYIIQGNINYVDLLDSAYYS